MKKFAYITLVFVCSVHALAVPQLISYQGSLTDSTGTPLDTTVSITFSIFDASAGGTNLWTETHPSVVIENGLFQVLLGSVTALSDLFSANRWLGITVGGDTEMSPRQQIVSVAHAYRVGTVDGASGGTISSDVIIHDRLNVGSGNVNSGTFAFVAGQNSTASGTNSVVSGGGGNEATANYTTVGGGQGNGASVAFATVGGGADNYATANGATIGGGRTNLASGPQSTVSGGGTNWASNSTATIGGGQVNVASGENATVSGGRFNQAIGGSSFIGGGSNNYARGGHSVVAGGGGSSLADSNSASGIFSGILGGVANSVSGPYSSVGGGQGNNVEDGWSVIGGGVINILAGGVSGVIGGGFFNQVQAQYGTVGGGTANQVTTSATNGVIAGGESNTCGFPHSAVVGGNLNSANDTAAFVGGGKSNAASGEYSTVSGGYSNEATNFAATISGGYNNSCTGAYGTVGGGYINAASGHYSSVAGGANNTASALYSFAAGYRARASHTGAFVWGSSNSSVDSTASFNSHTFTARCANGARFYTAQTGTATGVQLTAGGGAWSSLSDARQKENFRDVNTQDVLDKVSRLKISEWNYKSQDENIRHMGPMAQDFYAAFGLGESDTTITTVDPDGVLFAAIQELNKRNKQLQATNQDLQNQINQLRSLVQNIAAERQQSSKR